MAGRVTQDAVEIISAEGAQARVTQDAVEILSAAGANARVSQDALEIVSAAGAKARLTQVAVEILYVDKPGETPPREKVGLSDRLSHVLLPALNGTIRDRVGLSDRLTYSLLTSYTVTMRETFGLDDRLNGALITAITRTLREELAMRERRANDDTTSGSGVRGATQQPYGPQMVVLTHIFLDEGQENYSGHELIGSPHDHSGQVVAFGSIEKEVEIPTGAPRIADMRVVYNDHDGYWRTKFGGKTPRMRKADFLIGPRSGDESLFQRPATMTITHATFPPRQMVLDGRDQRSKFLDKPFPNVINSANYPNLPVGITEAFFPIVFGIHSSVGYGGQGVFRCIHVDTVQHRYTAAFHYIQDATVYTKTPEETEFQITPHSYTLVNEPIVINGRNFQPTYIQFAGALPDGTEVRADIEGSNFRDAWGTLAPINFVSRNPVDHNIGIISYAKLLESPTPDFSDYDLASFAEVHTKVTGMHSDYAITEPLTPNESLTQLNAPFIIHLVPDNHDRMKLVKITDADFENAPELNDFDGMLLKSEIISLAAPTYNRYRYRYAPNHTDGSFGAEETFDNTSDQEVLGEIEELQVDFHSVRDADVAAQLIAERAGWEDQDAHRIRLQLDAPTNLINVDLLKPFRLTHYGGLADGGWVNEAFITYRWRLDLDLMIFEIDAIRRVVVANPQDQLQAIGNWTLNHRAGVEYLTTARRLYECFVDTRSSASERKMVVLGSDTVGLMGPIDDGTYPALTNIIRSSDTKWHGNKLHIVTQEENTGRVGYSRLNGSAGLYEILNQTVLASNSHGDIGVTITVQNPSGLPVIMFQGDREHRTAWLARPGDGPEGDYRRAYVTVRGEDGTWSAPQMMGNPLDAFANLWFPIWGDPNYNGTVHINTGRAEAGLDNRVHFVFGRKEPGDVANTSDFCIQTLRTDGSLSQTCEFEMTVALGYSSDFLGGDPCGIEDTNGQYWVVFPVGKILEPKLCIWKDKDNPTIPDRIILLSTHQVPPATFGTQYAPIGVRAHGGKLHVIHGLRGGSADWAAYKTISQPFETSEAVPAYTSGSSADQIGPVWPVNTYSHHNFDIKTLRDGKTYIFKVTSGNFGVPDTDALSIHEKIDIAEDIPAAPDYTIADFVAEHS